MPYEGKIIGKGKFNVGEVVIVNTGEGEGEGKVKIKELLWHPELWGWNDTTPRWAYMIENTPDNDGEDVEGIHAESDLTRKKR